MSNHDPKVTLRQIADAARRAQELCAGKTVAELTADWRDRLALERVMEVLGEAVKRLPLELRERYPAVPWKQVAGTRDRVSHGYDVIDYKALLGAAQQDVPILLATVEQMLRDLETAPRPP
ncbi:MAG: HepT-like ribonuclease domain-containing protein [Planctomycetota bacterium]